MLDVQYQLTDVKKSARSNNDMSFTLESNSAGKPQFTATNVQPSAVDAMQLTQGVKLLSKGGATSGPTPQYDTFSKEEYNKKFKIAD